MEITTSGMSSEVKEEIPEKNWNILLSLLLELQECIAMPTKCA